MQIESRSVIYDAAAQPETDRVAFFDSVLRLKSGVWLSGFTAGQTKHHHLATIRLARSRDNGQTWELLGWRFNAEWNGVHGSLTGAEMVEVERGRLLLFCTWFDRTDPDRPLFDPETEGILRSRQLMAVSTDEGVTWTDWQIVPTPGLTGCAVTGPVVKWSDGTIAHAFESFKEYDDPAPPRHGAWVVVSRDGGRSFEPPFLIAKDPQNSTYYWDQRLCPGTSPGEFIGLFWTHDRAAKKDLRVTLARGSLTNCGMTLRVANDAQDIGVGRPLSTRSVESQFEPQIVNMSPVETTIPGQIAAPWLWPDGRLFAFVVDRDRPGTLRLWVSHDSGKTWPITDCLTVHTHDERANLSQGLDNIDFAQYWEDMAKWSFGHPSIRPFDENRLMLTYYAGPPGCLSIHSAIVRVV